MADKVYKAISVRDPWARAIIYLGKDVENRSWGTHYRGTLLVHCSQRSGNAPEIEDRLISLHDARAWPEACGRGCIIGVVDLDEIVLRSKSKWAASGMMHWVLRNPRPLSKPVPYRGQLGLFTVFERDLNGIVIPR